MGFLFGRGFESLQLHKSSKSKSSEQEKCLLLLLSHKAHIDKRVFTSQIYDEK